MKKTQISRERVANMLTVNMLRLRQLNSTSDNLFGSPDQPVWLEDLRRDLWKVIHRHLPHEFGVAE